MREPIRRGPTERLAAWVWTGPPGRLYGGLVDLALLIGRLAVRRVRRAIGRPAKAR